MCLRSLDGIRDAKSKSAGRRTCDEYDHDVSRAVFFVGVGAGRSLVRPMAASLNVSALGGCGGLRKPVGPTSEAGIGPAALTYVGAYRLASKESTIFRGCEIGAEVRATRSGIRRSDQAPRALSQARQEAPADQSQPASEPTVRRSSWRIH
jgi:hypothetical protein